MWNKLSTDCLHANNYVQEQNRQVSILLRRVTLRIRADYT